MISSDFEVLRMNSKLLFQMNFRAWYQLNSSSHNYWLLFKLIFLFQTDCTCQRFQLVVEKKVTWSNLVLSNHRYYWLLKKLARAHAFERNKRTVLPNKKWALWQVSVGADNSSFSDKDLETAAPSHHMFQDGGKK